MKHPRGRRRFALTIRDTVSTGDDEDSFYIPPPRTVRNLEDEDSPSQKHPKLQLYEDLINMAVRTMQVSSEHVIKFDDDRYNLLFDLIKCFYIQLVPKRPSRKGERAPKSHPRVYDDLFGDPSMVTTAIYHALHGGYAHIFTQDSGILHLLGVSCKILASDDLWPWSLPFARMLENNPIALYRAIPETYTINRVRRDFEKGEFYYIEPRTNRENAIREFVLENVRKLYFSLRTK